MDYESKFNDAYCVAREYKRKYLQSAIENECHKLIGRFCDYSISDEDYENIIVPYWKKYGVKPEKFWFEFYGFGDRRIEPGFIPGDIYYNDLIPYLNNLDFLRAASDKCGFDRMFAGTKMPETVCKCIGGLYYDPGMNMISEDEAVRRCLSHAGKLIIKPSVYNSASNNTFSVDPDVSDEKRILDLFKLIGANFIVQDRVRQHKELARFNSGTVNTIRIHSLLTEEGVYIPSALLRVGAPGQSVIELGSGGYIVNIEDDNRLSKTAYRIDVLTKYTEEGQKYHQYFIVPSADGMGGKYDDSYTVPAMDRIREITREIHPLIPHFRFVGWDFTVDEKGEPVLFEFNGSSDALYFQLASGKPIFGDMTEWVLDDFYLHRTLEKNHRQDTIYF